MPAFLVPVGLGQCLIPLEKAIVLIGRQADCDVSLTNSRKISRKHCCIAQVNNKYIVRDLGSTNGVFVNGNRIQKEATISVGDDLMIGDVKFKMMSEAPVVANSNMSKFAKGLVKSTVSPSVVASTSSPPRGISTTPLPLDDDDDTPPKSSDSGNGHRRRKSKR